MATALNMTAAKPANAGSNGYEEIRRQFFADVREAGRTAAQGEEAWHVTFLATIKTAADDMLTPEDAPEIVRQFIEARKSRTALAVDKLSKELKASTVKKLVSQFTGAINCGRLAEHAVPTMDRAIEIYRARHAEGAEMQSAYQSLVNVAKITLDSKDVVLSDEEIEAVMLKAAAKPKTPAAKLKAAIKLIEEATKLNEEDDAPANMERAGTAAALLAQQVQVLEALTAAREAKAAYEAAQAAAAHAARMAA